jgi:hypothetical protein
MSAMTSDDGDLGDKTTSQSSVFSVPPRFKGFDLSAIIRVNPR